MTISVKDIHEKDFSRSKRDGYNIDEVDDYLDEIADQLSILIRENIALAEQIKSLQLEKTAAPVIVAEPAPVAVASIASPDESAYDEPSYFKNLELAMRDTLINAQRIADETVADARKKAQQLVTEAEDQASGVSANAKIEVEAIKAEAEGIKKAISNYRTGFRNLVESQAQILKETNSLFD